jgi:integrase
MASALITKRVRKTRKSYVVRYRLGGRAYPLVHGGSFATEREARIRRDLIAGELAAGRNPADLLQTMTEKLVVRSFEQWADAWRQSRIDIAPATDKGLRSHIAKILETFKETAPAAVTVAQVQEWVAGLGLSPVSTRAYLATLRAVLDFAGVDPNPARDARIRLPRRQTVTVEPPSAKDVEAILANITPRWRLPLRVLEHTGLRVGEAEALEWRDVDSAGSRFRIRQGKTASARRWAAVPAGLMSEICDSCPPDDRVPERRVFIGFNGAAFADAMRRACKAAGVAHYHPHDLRHRYISVKIAEGVPITNISAQVGHSKKSLTLDTYSHVLLAD